MNNEQPIQVYFYEAHPLMILGIQALINQEEDLELCGYSSNHQTLVDELASARPQALILDLSLYTAQSLQFIADIRKHFPDLKIILLSIHTGEEYIAKAKQAGADAYVLKTDDPNQILEAVRAAYAGKPYISHRVSTESQKLQPIDSPINLLSGEEFQILQRIGKGETNRHIAEELSLPIENVEQEIASIQQKLGLSSFVELLQFAFHWVHHEGGFS